MPHVITLVHGTFAKNAAWCKTDSPLCQAISRALGHDVAFIPFVWSGRNSFRDRQLATDELVNHFTKLRASHPHCKHSAIAHSHGGNILVNAIARFPAGLDSAICLATPFFVIQARPEGLLIEKYLQMICLTIIGVIPGSIIYLGMKHLSYLASGRPYKIAWAVMSIVTPVFVYMGVKKAQYLNLAVFKSINERLLASGTKKLTSAHKVLLMRSPRDEATLSLGVVTFTNWLIDQIRNLVILLENKLLHPLFSSTVVSALTFIVVIYLFYEHHTLIYLLFTIWCISVVLGLAFLLSNAFLSFGFGVDVFLGVWRTRISVESSPPGLWFTYVVNAGRREAGMRHSLPYSSPEAIAVIVSWLTHDHRKASPALKAILQLPSKYTSIASAWHLPHHREPNPADYSHDTAEDDPDGL
jgi:hypothetical protein